MTLSNPISLSPAKARAVMQGVLNRLTQAIWDYDPDIMRQLTTDPHTMHTKQGIVTYHHDDSLDKALAQLHNSIHDMRVTDYVRSVTRARYVSEDMIEGQYRCWFLRNTLDVFPSFDAYMILVREDGQFRMREARNNIERGQWPYLSLSDELDGPPLKPGESLPSPFTQSDFKLFLYDISQPFIDRKIDRWAARIALPFSMVTRDGPITLSTPGDVKRNFADYLSAADKMDLDQIRRTPIDFDICDENTVMATYRTELISRGKRVETPYTSTALLHRTPDGWRMSSILNARGHHKWTGQHPNFRETMT